MKVLLRDWLSNEKTVVTLDGVPARGDEIWTGDIGWEVVLPPKWFTRDDDATNNPHGHSACLYVKKL